MNWITLAVLGGVAAWFEYSYRRSRHDTTATVPQPGSESPEPTVAQHAQVANRDSEPSIVPGDQNDKQMNAVV